MKTVMEEKNGFKKTELGWIPEDWNSKTYSALAEVIMGQSPNGSSYNQNKVGIPLINGPTEFTDRYPVKKQWTSSPTKICEKDDILICVRGSSTGRINIANDEYCIGRGVAAVRAKSNSYQDYVEAQLMFAVSRILRMTSGSTFPNISSTDLRNIRTLVPPLPEQKAIANCLSTWDTAITKLDNLIKAKQQLKKALMQQLLSGKKRLPGFDGEFKKTTAGEVFRSVTSKNHFTEELLSVTQDRGVIPRDMLEGRVTMPSGTLNGFKLVEIGNFVISLRSFQGGLEYSEYRGLVSPAYTILKEIKEINKDFYRHYFKSYEFIQRLSKAVIGIRDGKQISYTDFCIVKIPNISLAEQTAIAQVLNTADKEIALLTTQRNQLQLQKKGLMQQLLTGKKRLKV